MSNINHKQNLIDHKKAWDNQKYRQAIQDCDRKYELYCTGCTRKTPPNSTNMSTFKEAESELELYKDRNNSGLEAICPWCGKGILVARAKNIFDRVIDTMERCDGS